MSNKVTVNVEIEVRGLSNSGKSHVINILNKALDGHPKLKKNVEMGRQIDNYHEQFNPEDYELEGVINIKEVNVQKQPRAFADARREHMKAHLMNSHKLSDLDAEIVVAASEHGIHGCTAEELHKDLPDRPLNSISTRIHSLIEDKGHLKIAKRRWTDSSGLELEETIKRKGSRGRYQTVYVHVKK